jgi:hypothetical protein
MRVTVITNARGEVIASVEGSASSPPKRRGLTARVVPQEGQTFHEIDVPDSHAKLAPLDLLKALAKQVKG